MQQSTFFILVIYLLSFNKCHQPYQSPIHKKYTGFIRYYPSYIVSGIQDNKSNIRMEVAKTMQFEYKIFEKCILQSKQIDSIKKINEKTNQELIKIYGISWKDTFEIKVNNIYNNNKMKYNSPDSAWSNFLSALKSGNPDKIIESSSNSVYEWTKTWFDNSNYHLMAKELAEGWTKSKLTLNPKEQENIIGAILKVDPNTKAYFYFGPEILIKFIYENSQWKVNQIAFISE